MKRAVGAREHVDKLKEIEEATLEKRKPRLHWGFEMKKRWERKSNM